MYMFGIAPGQPWDVATGGQTYMRLPPPLAVTCAVYVYIYIYIHITCVCIYIYIYIYIHAYIYAGAWEYMLLFVCSLADGLPLPISTNLWAPTAGLTRPLRITG